METMIIHQSKTVLDGMCDWCLTTHTQSGLVAACLESSLTIEEADKILVTFLMDHTPFKKCPLAGNSVYNDKRFMEKFMPKSYEHLNYRIIDVSSFSEVMHRWLPNIQSEQPRKKLCHRNRALDDIKESIAQLAFYKKRIFDTH
ncbi:hypothetical protein MXB_2800 [Myxobolus squamalis]|nr:hypothetical protein MXB_2800 [Myxobolus squamalis]